MRVRAVWEVKRVERTASALSIGPRRRFLELASKILATSSFTTEGTCCSIDQRGSAYCGHRCREKAGSDKGVLLLPQPFRSRRFPLLVSLPSPRRRHPPLNPNHTIGVPRTTKGTLEQSLTPLPRDQERDVP